MTNPTIKDRLQSAGWSQTKLSIATGIHSATVSRLCHGLQPTADQRQLIADALGISPEAV